MQGNQGVGFYHQNDKEGSFSERSAGPGKPWKISAEKEKGLTVFVSPLCNLAVPTGLEPVSSA